MVLWTSVSSKSSIRVFFLIGAVREGGIDGGGVAEELAGVGAAATFELLAEDASRAGAEDTSLLEGGVLLLLLLLLGVGRSGGESRDFLAVGLEAEDGDGGGMRGVEALGVLGVFCFNPVPLEGFAVPFPLLLRDSTEVTSEQIHAKATLLESFFCDEEEEEEGPLEGDFSGAVEVSLREALGEGEGEGAGAELIVLLLFFFWWGFCLFWCFVE
jgi:hypothetical protein